MTTTWPPSPSMPMSDDERRKLQELEAELAGQRRMVRLSHRLSSANVDTGLRRVTVLWIAGGSTGLIMVFAGRGDWVPARASPR